MNTLLSCFILMLAARRRASTSGDPEVDAIVSLIFFASLAAIAIAYFIAQKRSAKNSRAQLISRQEMNLKKYREWRKSTANGIDPINTELRLDDDEACYLRMPAILCEPRAVRQSTHTGGAMRIARGITIGRGYSTSESHEEWRKISAGCLYVTNKRLLFDGDMQNRTIKIRDVVSVQRGNDYVAVSSEKRLKTMVFFGLNGLIATDVIKSLLEQYEG